MLNGILAMNSRIHLPLVVRFDRPQIHLQILA